MLVGYAEAVLIKVIKEYSVIIDKFLLSIQIDRSTECIWIEN